MLHYLLRTCYRSSPRAALAVVGCLYGSKILTMLMPAFLAALIGAVAEGQVQRTTIFLVCLCLSMGASSEMRRVGTDAFVRLVDLTSGVLEREAAASLAQIATLDEIEASTAEELYLTATDSRDGVAPALRSLLAAGTMTAGLLGTIITTLILDPRLLVLWVFALPTLILLRRTGPGQLREGTKRAELYTAIWRLQDATLSERGQRETIGYRLDWPRRLDGLFRELRRITAALHTRVFAVNLAADAIFCCGSLWWWHTLSGMSAGSQLGAIFLVLNMRGSFSGLLRIRPAYLRCAQVHSAFTKLRRLAQRSQAAPTVAQAIALEDVTYQHPGATSPALAGVSFSFRPGIFYAIVGANGSGKTTLCELLMGLRVPTAGRVLTGGPHRSCGVPQDYLRARLRLVESLALATGGEPDHRAEQVAARLGLADIDQSGPLVADQGLSGGQYQRIAIARAMLKAGTPLICLDEASSALDADAEAELMGMMREMGRSDAVTVLVTHRIVSALGADYVLVLDRGRLVEHGSPDELLGRGGLFATYVDLQRGRR